MTCTHIRAKTYVFHPNSWKFAEETYTAIRTRGGKSASLRVRRHGGKCPTRPCSQTNNIDTPSNKYPKIQICVGIYAKTDYLMRTVFCIISISMIIRELFLILHGHKRAR